MSYLLDLKMASLLCRKHICLHRNWNLYRQFSRTCNQHLTCPVKILQTSNSTLLTSESTPKVQVPLAQSTIHAWLNNHRSFSSTPLSSEPSKLILDPFRITGSLSLNHKNFSSLGSRNDTPSDESFPVLSGSTKRTVTSNEKSFSTTSKRDEFTKPLLDSVKRTVSSSTNQKSSSKKDDESKNPIRSSLVSQHKSFSTTPKQDESVIPQVELKATQKPVKSIAKHEEHALSDGELELQSKIKLKEGDAALVVKGSDEDRSGGCRVDRYSLDDVQQKFSAIAHIVKNNTARGYLNNFGQMYKSVTGKELDLKLNFSRYALQEESSGDEKGKKKKKKESHWSCFIKLKSPFPLEVRSVADTKVMAGDLVAKLMIHELFANKLINLQGKALVSAETKKKLLPSKDTPVDAMENLLNICSVEALENVTQKYDKHIVPLIHEFEHEENQRREAERQEEEAKELEKSSTKDPTESIAFFSRPFNTKVEHQRNRQLERKAEVLMEKATRTLQSGQRKKLPIEDYRQEIVDNVASNAITIIKGEPGCGKSTQVAQMLLNEASLRGQGSSCNILITQPRRISAISLAKRVASEREEPVGESVGYQVRLQHIFPRHAGHIQFITTGILLSRLQTQRGLDQVSHIILDEAHERDISTDLLLLLTKRLLTERPALKLLVMSATLNAEMFQRYFESAPVLHIPGFTHPVQRNYLSLENGRRWSLCKSEDDTKNLVSSREPTTNSETICNLILWIHRNKPEGAILCFLPGWQDIVQVSRILQASRDSSSLYVAMAHSKLDTEVQGAIFSHPPPGIRKVVLSTNVAETSITIDDVSYVVDTGCHKETRYDAKDDVVSLDNHWISRASVNQRAGRAGRTKPGESFHLYTEERFKKMAEYSLPEIFRKPLEEILLTCKLYGNEKSEDFLLQLPEPPDFPSIQSAVNELKLMGVFDATENLTPLGKRIAAMQCHPKLACALVHGVLFKCALPIGNIVTLLSTPERPLFENAILNTSKDAIRDIKSNLSRYSDHIAGSRIMNDWGSNSARRGHVLEYLHERNLRHLYDVRDQLMNTLYANRLLDEETDWAALTPPRGLIQSTQNVNRLAHIDELVRGVLYAGVQNLLVSSRARGKQRLCTEQGQMCTMVRESVNSGLKSAASPLLVYYDATTSLQRRITSVRDSSVISPLALILFRRGTATLLSHVEAVRIKSDLNEGECIISLKNELKPCNIIVTDWSQGVLLLRLRSMVSRLSLFFISHQGHPLSGGNIEAYLKIDRYWDQLLDCVAPLFAHYTRRIDDYRHEIQDREQVDR